LGRSLAAFSRRTAAQNGTSSGKASKKQKRPTGNNRYRYDNRGGGETESRYDEQGTEILQRENWFMQRDIRDLTGARGKSALPLQGRRAKALTEKRESRVEKQSI